MTGSSDKTARLWDVATGSEVRHFEGNSGIVNSVAFSPDGRFVLMGSVKMGNEDNTARLWEVATGKEVRRFEGHSNFVFSVAFSPDGHFVLTGSSDNTARLWDAATGKEVRRFEGHLSSVFSVAFSSDGSYVLTGSEDSTTRLWNASNGDLLCSLISFRDGTWVVVDPEDRFDTNNLEEVRGLHWIAPDDPLTPLPIEIFMRDYYEPRLLSRILAGEKLRPVRSLADLNRVQPGVKITKITPQKAAPDKVSVTVEVSKARGEFQRENGKVILETGIYNLRLFRNGQLVGYAPKTDGEIELEPKTGKAFITFTDIKIPRKQDLKQVEFSAYAFNVDRVKSATDRKTFIIPNDLTPLKGRAYIITVGVNAYENPDWNLKFAANDARLIQQVVSERLSQSEDYKEIVQIPLISDYAVREGKIVVTENRATKRNFKTVLDLLSGRKVDPRLSRAIPNAERIRQARPEDLVLISFSSHEYADKERNFYLIPYDTGEVKEFTANLSKHCISSDELFVWFRDIDAGEMAMIVDACHSAAAVEGKEFKPGPMGSRELGQLSYDKGIRILTATQADDVALEVGQLKQGLLTYAIVEDGIEAGGADFKPKDRVITVSEWLAYGVERVPKLYEEVRTGRMQLLRQKRTGQAERSVELVETEENGKSKKRNNLNVQQPSLFDFTKKGREVVLTRLEHTNNKVE